MTELEKRLVYRIGQACWWFLQGEGQRKILDPQNMQQRVIASKLGDVLSEVKRQQDINERVTTLRKAAIKERKDERAT